MDFKAKVGQYDQTIVKVYGTGENKKIKVINLAYLQTRGLENDSVELASQISKEQAQNDEKLRESIARAKQKIFELAFCNEWDYFFTGTLDSTKYNREDLEEFHHDLTKWINNQSAKRGQKIEYLLVPELHADGKSWHMHGFIKGIDKIDLVEYKVGMPMSKSIAAKIGQGDRVFNWTPYSKKFGFCTVEIIRNTEAISKYIQKYMSKELGVHVSELGAHLYYHSRGLNTAQFVMQGSLTSELVLPLAYQSEWTKIYWLDYNEEILNELRANLFNTSRGFLSKTSAITAQNT